MPRSCLAKADYVCCKRGSWRPLAKDNSYGLTTLKTRHVTVDGNEVRFRVTGKSGKQWSLRVKDRRIAKIIKACQELPGQELLRYLEHCVNERSFHVEDDSGNVWPETLTVERLPSHGRLCRSTFGASAAE
jgi:DNA topoisomerase IB